MGYCTTQDVRDLGFPAEMFQSRPRVVQVLDVPSGTFKLRSHGFDAHDVITFDLTGAPVLGLPAPTIPTGTSLIALYYPVVLTSDLFHLSLIVGGSPITITDAGTGTFSVLVDPERKLQRIVDAEAGDIDARLTSHKPPLQRDPVTGLYPSIVVTLNARLAGRKAIPVFGMAAPQFLEALKLSDADLAHDWAKLEDWDKGQPINPALLAQPNAEDAARAASGITLGTVCDQRWVTGYL